MVIRKYTETEGRDPSVLLGIDGSAIPFEYFEGIYKDIGLIFTDDIFGAQFRVDPEGVVIYNYHRNPDDYVLAEDLLDKKWILVGSWFVSQNEDFFSESSQTVLAIDGHTKLYNKVLERYLGGERGLLEESKKVYNKAGDWMLSEVSFDTERETDLLNKIRHHSDFIFRDYAWIPWEEREMTLRASKKMLERIQEEVLKPMIISMFYIETSEGMIVNNAMIISVGKIFFVEDESIEGIIIEKNGE